MSAVTAKDPSKRKIQGFGECASAMQSRGRFLRRSLSMSYLATNDSFDDAQASNGENGSRSGNDILRHDVAVAPCSSVHCVQPPDGLDRPDIDFQ